MSRKFEATKRKRRGAGITDLAGASRIACPAGFAGAIASACPFSAALGVTLLALIWPGAGFSVPLALSTEPGVMPTTATTASTTTGNDLSSRVTSLTVSAASTRVESALFQASFVPIQWTGSITAFKVTAGTGAVVAAGLWDAVPRPGLTPDRPATTATFLDDPGFVPADRVVLSAASASNRDGATSPIGISWTWESLAEAQKNALRTVDLLRGESDASGRQRLDYLRGNRTLEGAAGGIFRDRVSRQGDIVNSKLWHVAGAPGAGYGAPGYAAFKSLLGQRAAMLYVGANDGMLHGFSAATGREKIAYVPLGVHAQLPLLTRAPYVHRYFVDGSPFTADINVDGTWKTYLAGFPGRGGKGYFVLDVTDPDRFGASEAARLVVLDQTDGSPADIGHITGEPVRERDNTALTRQITQLNNRRWALVTGNGYNSASETAALLIQYLDGKRELTAIPTTRVVPSGLPTGNGLSAPRLIDLDGDKIPDIAYAGDLLGNMWKFDLTSGDAGAWATAFGGAPLYVAKDESAPEKVQPVTVAPVWVAHPNGGVMVVFGTGRNLTDADRTDMSRQTIYGVYDDTVVTRDAGKVRLTSRSGTVPAGRGTLVRQDISPTAATTGTAGALWTVSSYSTPSAPANAKRGWYLDLPAGERVLGNPAWFQGNLVDISSTVPATGRTWLTTLNAINGNAPASQIYADVASAKTIGVANPAGSASRIEIGLRTSLINPSKHSEKGLCASGQSCSDRALLPSTALRPSWRQLQ